VYSRSQCRVTHNENISVYSRIEIKFQKMFFFSPLVKKKLNWKLNWARIDNVEEFGESASIFLQCRQRVCTSIFQWRVFAAVIWKEEELVKSIGRLQCNDSQNRFALLFPSEKKKYNRIVQHKLHTHTAIHGLSMERVKWLRERNTHKNKIRPRC
jgi:hypothetical protein